MAAKCYYNEHDPFAAAWLRELIAWNMIAPGDVDERSIEDVCADDLRGYVQHHFFAGIGVWSAALRGAGWPDDRPVWTGSCPCQPFSAAGKGGGFADERHLWPAWHWLIRQHRPDVVFGEQVASRPGLAWFDLVSADLEGEGYAVGPIDLCAAGVGAPHIRQRLWFVAVTRSSGGGRDARTIPGAQGSGGRQGVEARCVPDQPVADGTVVDATGEQAGLPRRAWQSGGAGGVGHHHQRLEGRARPAERGDQRFAGPPGVAGALQHAEGDGRIERRPEPERWRAASSWGTPDWIPCRDGKWRPVEAGTFPLAHGAPARVGLLRGYGNALVLPVAQAFIAAALTVLP